MDDPPGRFACPRAREAADDPFPVPGNSAAQLRGNRVLRQIEERGQRRLLDKRVQAFPLRDGREPRAVASPTNGTYASAELVVPRSMPMEKRAVIADASHPASQGRPYSVRTWNSIFHRRSELVCFIQSSSVPSSVTTASIRTGTTCPAGSIGQRRNLDFEQAGFLQLTFGIGQDLSRRVAASHGGGEEPELRRLAGDKAERRVPRSAVPCPPACPAARRTAP